jgi:hypothetical protein
MHLTVNAFLNAKIQFLAGFNCPGDYFINPLTESPWRINESKEMPVLSYENKNHTHHAVIVQQNNQPLIYRAGGYALVVAIDCVKVAFLLDERREQKS